jgi:hypothetical protein
MELIALIADHNVQVVQAYWDALTPTTFHLSLCLSLLEGVIIVEEGAKIVATNLLAIIAFRDFTW